MFKKIPYGVKVRVRGNDTIGYVAEYAICCSHFFPFMTAWSIIKNYSAKTQSERDMFPTFEAAQEAAMEQYDQWIQFYKSKEQEEKTRKQLKKTRAVWEHP